MKAAPVPPPVAPAEPERTDPEPTLSTPSPTTEAAPPTAATPPASEVPQAPAPEEPAAPAPAPAPEQPESRKQPEAPREPEAKGQPEKASDPTGTQTATTVPTKTAGSTPMAKPATGSVAPAPAKAASASPRKVWDQAAAKEATRSALAKLLPKARPTTPDKPTTGTAAPSTAPSLGTTPGTTAPAIRTRSAAKPAPRSVPAAAKTSEIPKQVHYEPNKWWRVLQGVAFVVCAVLAVVLLLAFLGNPSGSNFVSALLFVGGAVLSWWVVNNWHPPIVTITDGILDIEHATSATVVDLRDPATRIALATDPKANDWRAVVDRPDGGKVTLRRRHVDPEEFSRIVEHYRRIARSAR